MRHYHGDRMSTDLARADADAPAVEVLYPVQEDQAGATLMPAQASSDEEMVTLWLHGRPAATVKAYRRDVAALLAYTGATLQTLTLGQLQRFAEALGDRAPRSQARTLSAIKSLLSRAHMLGYVRYNVGAALVLPKIEDTRGERIVSEGAIHRLLALTPEGRDGLIVRLFYYAGIRCNELARLCWRNVQRDGQGRAVLAVHGKGSKTRYVLLGSEIAALLDGWHAAAGDDAQPDAPIFRAVGVGQRVGH